MAETVEYLVDQTLDFLVGSHTPVLNQLDSSIDGLTETIVAKHDIPANLGAAAVLQVESELMYVFDIDTSTNTFTVLRGYKGTQNQTHDADDLIEYNPRFPRKLVLDTLRDEILSWPSSLFKITEQTATIDDDDYDEITLTDAALLRVLRVYYTNEPGNQPHWSVQPAKASAAGDREVVIRTYPRRHSREGKLTEVTVLYAAHFTVDSMTESDNVVTDLGMRNHMTDIAYLGAAYRLLAREEAKNSNVNVNRTQRMEESLQVGQTIQSAGQLKVLRDQRIQEEIDRLKQEFPPTATQTSHLPYGSIFHTR